MQYGRHIILGAYANNVDYMYASGHATLFIAYSSYKVDILSILT